MKKKATSEFTEEEKNWMDTIAVNYIIAQSDGYQLGYAQALNDLTSYIVDYWNGSDDKPQQSVLDAIIDLGVELGKRQETAKENIRIVKERGYENYYNWQYRSADEPFGRNVNLFTKDFNEDKEGNNEN
ncbi:MAG: hypothetical protein Q4G23_11040 [Clostridia bacterium]|nr:hypothetical protein [Clostridia bacterium]